ncbi:hypothetical protein ON010_g14718 [Phytophthora cinnamomi]|nr:hypothetical protein ON010_g14718 [Phytophthora cinnamomi]
MEKTIALRNTEITFSIWDLGGHREFISMLPLVVVSPSALHQQGGAIIAPGSRGDDGFIVNVLVLVGAAERVPVPGGDEVRPLRQFRRGGAGGHHKAGPQVRQGDEGAVDFYVSIALDQRAESV